MSAPFQPKIAESRQDYPKYTIKNTAANRFLTASRFTAVQWISMAVVIVRERPAPGMRYW